MRYHLCGGQYRTLGVRQYCHGGAGLNGATAAEPFRRGEVEEPMAKVGVPRLDGISDDIAVPFFGIRAAKMLTLRVLVIDYFEVWNSVRSRVPTNHKSGRSLSSLGPASRAALELSKVARFVWGEV